MKHTPYTDNLSSGDTDPWNDHKAKCADLPPAVIDTLFFGDPGFSAAPARRFCLGHDGGPRCPLLEQCRTEGADEKYGIWGAQAPEERATIRLGKTPFSQLECGHLDVPTNIRIQEDGARVCRYCNPRDTTDPDRFRMAHGRPRQNSEQHEAKHGHPLQITGPGRKCLVCDRNRKRQYNGRPIDVPLPLGRPRKESAA